MLFASGVEFSLEADARMLTPPPPFPPLPPIFPLSLTQLTLYFPALLPPRFGGWCLRTTRMVILSLGAEAAQAIHVEAGVVAFAQGRRVQPRRLVDYPGKPIGREPRARGGGSLWCSSALLGLCLISRCMLWYTWDHTTGAPNFSEGWSLDYLIII